MIVIWSCNVCDVEFERPPKTRDDPDKTPWHWCPKCKASAQPVSIRTIEGTFHGSKRKPMQ